MLEHRADNPWLVDALEVLDGEHFDGVVQVLHRAKTGTLRTKSGSYTVRPTQSPGSQYLFGLDFITECDTPESLKIDALELNFGDTTFALDGSSIEFDNLGLKVLRPKRLFSAGTRIVDIPSGTATLYVTYEGRELPTRVWGFSVEQIFVAGFDDEVIDLSLHHARLEYIDDGSTVEVLCTVAFQGFTPMGYVRLNVYTKPDERSDLVHIYRLIRFPKLRDRGELPASRVVDLFRASHYLDLRETESSEPTAAWCCPDFAGDLSIDTIYRASEGELLGHVSVTRAYSRTWLGHQLTTLKGHPESADCRIALYNHFASAPGTIDGADNVFLLGYYDRSKRWHQLFFESFVDWMSDSSKCAVVPFDRYETADADAPGMTVSSSAAVEVHRGRNQELEFAVALIRDQLPALAAEAFDISAEKLDVDYLHPEYERRSVVRGREAFVVCEQGELVGVALIESGSRHLSLFNLFNLTQLYFTPSASPAAKSALFRFVRRYYADQGILDPILVTRPGACDNAGDAGLRLDETMGCIIWTGRSLEQYQPFIRYCFEKIGDNSLTHAKTG